MSDLSQVAKDAIGKALASRDAATQADLNDAVAVQAQQAADAAEMATKAATITSHKEALDDAHAALDVIMSEFNVSPPKPNPPTPVIPPNPSPST